MTDKLSELRQTINQLDDEILALVRRRMVLAADVIAAKNGGAAYRPGREAEVMARLVASAPDLPAGLVVNLWRQLMTASTALQSDSMTIAVHRDAMAVAGWHFGGFFTTIGCDDLASVRQAMADGADTLVARQGTNGPELEVVSGRQDSAAGDGARVIGVIASNGKTD